MTWQHIYLIIIFAAVVVSLGIAIYAWIHRRRTGAPAFSGMMFAVAFWLFTSGVVSMSRTPEQARAWVDPRYFGLTVMLAFFILYAIRFSRRGKWLNRTRSAIILAVPVVTQVIIATNSLHHGFLMEVSFSQDGILMGLDSVQYGPIFWLHTVYSYGLVLAGIGLIVEMSIRTFRLYRIQAATMIVGIVPTVATSAIDAFLLIPGLKHPLSPIGFAFTGMVFAWAMFRHRMLNIIPVAREAVIDSMSDGVIVLDAEANIVDVNPAALQYLQLDSSQVIGSQAAQVFHPWSHLVDQYQDQPFGQSEIAPTIQGQVRYFDLRISPLQNESSQPSGRIVILRDITSRKRAENQLQETLSTVKALQEQLYEQAIRDSLTGLYNRRFFDETIPREIQRAVREGYALSFVMMDIDHFKVVNDTFGHEAGDEVLRQVAVMLEEQTRASDYAFRYGGEEFLVVLPDTPPESAHKFAERWRNYLEHHRVRFDERHLSVTMSIGIAAITADGETPETVLSAADNAMYRAKANGRNCVVLYTPVD